MATFVEHLQAQGLSRATTRLYQRHLVEFLAFLDKDGTDPDQATGKEVAAHLGRLQQRGLAAITRAIHLNVLRRFFAWRVGLGAREDNPAEHLRMRGAQRHRLHTVLSVQELDALHASYPTGVQRERANWLERTVLSRQRNKAILGLLVHQGLTTTEVAALQLTHLRLREALIEVPAGTHGQARTLDLKAAQIIELMEYVHQVRGALLQFHREGEQALFLSVPSAGRTLAQGGSLQVWKGLSKELAERHPRFVNLAQVRASVITHWLGAYHLRRVQYMAGHRFISSTERYLQGRIADLQADIDRFHPSEH